MDDQLAEADALLLGRKTYEIFAAHWPNIGDDDPAAKRLNSMPKYVNSLILEVVEWNNSTLLDGEASEAVAERKESAGVLLVQGSQNLIQTFRAHDLVDEFWLWVFLVVVGPGKRLFGEGTTPAALELTTAETSSTGVQILRYERAGDIEHGSFALET